MTHYPEDELQRQADIGDAHMDDGWSMDRIGDDLTEREQMIAEDRGPFIDEPDDQGLVGALVAQCGYLIGDLATVDNTALLVDQSREDLATTIRDLDKMLQLIGTVRDDVAQALALLMEKDLEIISGMGVERSRALRTEWNKDGATRAVRFAIIERWVPSGTAEDLRKSRCQLVDRVLADVATAYSTTPKVNGLKALQIDPNEFRATTRAERYTVKVTT